MASFTTFPSSGTSMSALSMQEVLDTSSLLIDSHLNADSKYADLSDLLKVPNHKSPSVSGLQDFDYPSPGDSSVALPSLAELSPAKRVPLPPELVEQFGRMQCNCMMGLFPGISRAWLSIDSDIFVWNYEDGGDLAYFDGLTETILSASLVKPKAGIFQGHIQFLLCLATAVDIVLLGVSFTHGHDGYMSDYSEMHLLPDPLFSIPTDNTCIQSIQGTDNGRIFMAGKDGCLHELLYQAHDGWFSRKCSKTNHSTSSLSFLVPSFLNFSFSDADPMVQIDIDESRHILYTRSEKGTIQVYDLGEDGMKTSRVAALTQQTTVQNAALMAKTIDKSNLMPIVHIEVIPKTESLNIHLVAVTGAGVRIYFTTTPFNQPSTRPYMLSLVHVRLPPGFSASGSVQRPTKVHMAHYRRGTLLLSSSQTEDSDLLWAMGPDTFPFQNSLMETQMTFPIDGRSWALTEVPVDTVKTTPLMHKSNPPLVVTQHIEPIRRFVLLSAQGSHLMNKLRPLDQLRQLLINNSGPDSPDVHGFFSSLHSEDQACATCLILACSKLAVDKQISEWATRAFFLYGGEAKCSFDAAVTGSNVSNIGPNITVGGMSQGDIGSSYLHQPPHGHLLSPQGQPLAQGQDVKFSGKHEGVCLYLSRILRPLWDSKVVSDLPVQTSQGMKEFLASSFTAEDLSCFLQQLFDLKEFLEKHSKFAMSLVTDRLMPTETHRPLGLSSAHDGIDENTRRKLQAESQLRENKSMQQIEIMIQHICETLSLWKILCDHQFHVVAACLTKDQQNYLKTMTFRNLVVTGKDMCSALITCLVNRYLGDNASTDAISSKLREVCPSLYSSDDALASKANEILQASKVSQNNFEKNRLLKEALMLYKQIPNQINLPVVCTQFSSVRFYDGIVDLCLSLASKRDPQFLALAYYKNREPAEDSQGMQAYMARMDCYKCIVETLNYLLTTTSSHPSSPSMPVSPGPPPGPDPNKLTNSEAELHSEKVFNFCLKSEDELFHVALYEWLIRENLTEKLIAISSPYLESYLKQAATTPVENLLVLDLLSRYYEKNKKYSEASKILSKLADRHGTDTSLYTRIEYLSRAIMCAKSSALRTSSAMEGEFLHDLEEKMEVARIQLKILDTLTKMPSHQSDEAVSRLNADLLDITTLYGDFGEPFQLSECKLAIVHCAGHFDAALIQSLWREIVDRELDQSHSLPPQSRMSMISNKLINIGKQYVSADLYFPVAFIVKLLERKSCELNLDHKWVFRTMMEVGVNLPKLHEVYDTLFKSKDPCWQSARKPFHLLFVLHSLLETYATSPSSVPSYERRHFTSITLDSVAGYLVDLQSQNASDPTVQTLIIQFKSLQAKLERH